MIGASSKADSTESGMMNNTETTPGKSGDGRAATVGAACAPVAIIGFGTAGVNAAIGLRTGGYSGDIRVFSDHHALPFSPILTSYYAGGDKSYDECFPWSADMIDSLRLDVMHDSPVVKLDVAAHTVSTATGEFPYSKCVIATGASPTTTGFPACTYDPLVLRTMEDAERLREAISADGCKRVLVSGASMVALKMLEACLHQGVNVTLVGMNPHVLDFNALPEAATRFERGLAGKGVELRLGQTIKAVDVVEDDAHPLGRRLDVTFSNGQRDAFDEICVAHGMRCNLDFLENGALEVDRAIVVDDHMRASNADVYAAGDVTEARELVSGEKRIVGIWKNAALQGRSAGRAIAAELAGSKPSDADAFKGSIAMNTIAVDGTLFISAGSVDKAPNRRVEVAEGDDMTVVKVYEQRESGECLVGFNITSDSDEEGSVAYDTGAMLTLRIERALAR